MSIYKIGDKVKILSRPHDWNGSGFNDKDKVAEVIAIDPYKRNILVRVDCNTEIYLYDSNVEPLNQEIKQEIKTTNMKSIFEILKASQIQEPEKSLLEAGFIKENSDNHEYEFTSEGRQLLDQILYKSFQKDLLEFAKTKIDFIKKEEDEKKSKS